MIENDIVLNEELWISMAEDIHHLTVLAQSFFVIVGILLSAFIARWIWRRVIRYAFSFIKF